MRARDRRGNMGTEQLPLSIARWLMGRTGGTLKGGADPRGDGAAIGY